MASICQDDAECLYTYNLLFVTESYLDSNADDALEIPLSNSSSAKNTGFRVGLHLPIFLISQILRFRLLRVSFIHIEKRCQAESANEVQSNELGSSRGAFRTFRGSRRRLPSRFAAPREVFFVNMHVRQVTNICEFGGKVAMQV